MSFYEARSECIEKEPIRLCEGGDLIECNTDYAFSTIVVQARRKLVVIAKRPKELTVRAETMEFRLTEKAGGVSARGSPVASTYAITGCSWTYVPNAGAKTLYTSSS
jgi:hypothetical protein